MRRVRILLSTVLAIGTLAGCGASFKLPTESRGNRIVPGDKSYQMLQTWKGMHGVVDLLLLPQGTSEQLYLVFNTGGAGTAPRGAVRPYSLTSPTPITTVNFQNLFNPVAVCGGGDGAGAALNRLYVLDQGDTSIARANPATGQPDTVGGWDLRISDLAHYWRVREYHLAGGDTVTSFTDTTFAFVSGVAADAAGSVYVSGLAIVILPNPNDIRLHERVFQFRVFKYSRGPRYAGVVPNDRNMPGAAWHRDTTFVSEVGNGTGFVVDPRGMFWNRAIGDGLYVADLGNNRAQRLYDVGVDNGYFALDGTDSGENILEPLDVTADVAGYSYICDTGGRRVLRYDPYGSYVQRVDVEPSEFGQLLHGPVAVAADDSLVYVADRYPAYPDSDVVIRYKRRP
jgi:hypothetical protein